MTNKLIFAVAKKIHEVFGESFKIYTEEIRQGFFKPCFFIKLGAAEVKRELGNRRKLINPIIIHFFPDESKKNLEMGEAYERLFEALEYIEMDGKILRGTEMSIKKSGAVLVSGLSTSYENGEGMLSFYVNFDFHITYGEKSEYMQRLCTDFSGKVYKETEV